MHMTENTDPQLVDFLADQVPVAETWPVWGNGRVPLREHTYLNPRMPPDEFITSVRAIFFRGDEVMVIQDHQDDPYVVPGGRRDPGETVLETLHREIKEETGWSITDMTLLGFVHFHHLGPKPANHPYAYPDFVQVIYAAVADKYYPEAIQPDPYVTHSAFLPIKNVLAFDLKDSQKVLLKKAVNHYRSKT